MPLVIIPCLDVTRLFFNNNTTFYVINTPIGFISIFSIIGSTFRPNPYLSKSPSVPSTQGYQLESIRNGATMQSYNATWRDEIKCNLRHRKEFESFGWHPPPLIDVEVSEISLGEPYEEALAFLAQIQTHSARFLPRTSRRFAECQNRLRPRVLGPINRVSKASNEINLILLQKPHFGTLDLHL